MISYQPPRTKNGAVFEHHVVQYLDQILQYAIHRHASDIHIEPGPTHLTTRMRFDGLLHIIAKAPLDIAAALISRIKILARCDIALKNMPQDGRIHLSEQQIDLRVSTCPTLHGEKVVLRLLNAHRQQLNLAALGLDTQTQQLICQALAQPQGMILVTGPTDSGKTSTLYCLLDQLNDSTRNICTIEDPIEITLPGVNQKGSA